MSDWPDVRMPDATSGGGIISVAGVIGGGYMVATNVTSTAWPSANLAILIPFQISSMVTVYKIAIGAGTTASGNFDAGIYDLSGHLLVSSGATAKGSGTEHILNVTDTTLGPGAYYMAMAANGTNNYMMITLSGTSPVPLQKTRWIGVLNAASSYTLPSTITFAAATFAPIPAIALYLRPY